MSLFFCLFGLTCGKCNIISLYFLYLYINISVCLVCCVSDSVCQLLGETICNMFGCDFYSVVESYGFEWVAGEVLSWIDHRLCLCMS